MPGQQPFWVVLSLMPIRHTAAEDAVPRRSLAGEITWCDGHRAAVNLDLFICMQRLFSTFPRGAPGMALVMLRVSVAAEIFSVGGLPISVSPWWLSLQIGLAGLLTLGALTPVLALLCCLAQIATTLSSPPDGMPMALISVANALSLALLGPGAYSLDARAFGRRLVVLPPPRDLPGR
jgi:uncharacterized membrane protein YphA (DoxX/SURF4 family)